jgi:hypothetical protein
MSQMRRQGNRMWSFLPLPVLRGRVGEGARAGDALGKPPPYPPPEYRGRGKEGFTDPHAIALPWRRRERRSCMTRWIRIAFGI